jgi:hypothetical protein
MMRSADRAVHKFVASEALVCTYFPVSGLNAAYPDICFAVAQGGLLWSQNNSAWSQVNWNNYAQYATVFQEYRIMSFSIEMFCNFNTVFAAAANTNPCLPMVYSVVDREDAVKLPSASSALQYASVHISQAGSVQGSKTTTCVAPAAFIALDNDATFLGTITASGMARQMWLSCGTNSASSQAAIIPHGYIKYFFDPNNGGSPLTTQLGNITFICRCAFEYKGID